MKALNVIIAQGDCVVAQFLASALHAHFNSVSVARSSEELRNTLKKLRPDVAVVDLETMDMDEISQLCRNFGLPVIATHRIPDEKMWTDALSVGASDCCEHHDVRNIVEAISRSAHRRFRLAQAA